MSPDIRSSALRIYGLWSIACCGAAVVGAVIAWLRWVEE